MHWSYYALLFSDNKDSEALNWLFTIIIIIGGIVFICSCLSAIIYGFVCLKDYILDNFKNNKEKKYISQDELLEKINKWKNEKDKE